ncbi:MAG: hypothetical protein OXE43_02850 [Chloroflexi bacterium]|nr:hypothetical protein [Chloroflexota bacterium]
MGELKLKPNWTTAAGALEGVLAAEGLEMPRHAVMGLTGHAWHLCLASEGDVTALPSGPHDLDWGAMVERYARTGLAWERFARRAQGEELAGVREAAIAWARERLDAGVPLIGFDLQIHEFAIVRGYSVERGGFLVESAVSEEMGGFAPWSDWPTPSIGIVELFAPVGPSDPDPEEAVVGALQTAVELMSGGGGESAHPRGTAALEAWADAFEGTGEIDRAGNAYTLAVLQAARTDGAAFLGDLAEAVPGLAIPLMHAQRAVLDLTQALSPLLTLFPFPAGGHGSVSNPGLREAAANALRRAAAHERRAAASIAEALDSLGIA